MAKQHAPRFLEIVNDAKSRVAECTVDEVKRRLDAGESFHLIDVREESEFARGRLPGAIPPGKGVIERDVEKTIDDPNAELILYCGGDIALPWRPTPCRKWATPTLSQWTAGGAVGMKRNIRSRSESPGD